MKINKNSYFRVKLMTLTYEIFCVSFEKKKILNNFAYE